MSAQTMTKAIDVTVVVGTYNRAEMLRQTLSSLTALETERSGDGRLRYEVVVVDNASTDHTPRVIAETDPGAAVAIRGFHETQPGVAFARNHGIREARGEWIAFHDDDQVAHPRWLVELLGLAQRRGLSVVGGNVVLRLPEGSRRDLAPAARDMLGERTGRTAEQPYGRKFIPGTNNLLVKRAVLDEVGLFNVGITDGGEDAELWRRIRSAGYQAWYTPESITYHLIPEKRLGDDYMRWTARRKGQHVARRERLDWGWLALWPVAAARLGQAVVSYLPRYIAARLSGDPERTLGARCLLWRSQGYLHQAWQLLLGKSANVAGGAASTNFREGRESLVAAKEAEGQLAASN